jgi:hypothetical protein
MKIIPLCNHPKTIIVDDEDYPTLSKYTWKLNQNKRIFAMGSSLAIARLITQATPQQRIYYINNNIFDNRRCNLEIRIISKYLPPFYED